MRDATDLVAKRAQLMRALLAVVDTLDEYQDILEDCPGVRPMRETAEKVKAESDALLEEGRLLRLGIVGQIKAGKSTLLNLLLFDGREVLPRAATPMTASLTHIVRNESLAIDQAEITVEYYSREEWQQIEEHAAAYRKAKEAGRTPDDFLKASHELIEMAQKRRIRVSDHPDTDTQAAAIDDLNRQLRSLVGADGELTPLVKSVTIQCGQGIPDLDIVDTPGLNDPILSRVRETQKLLAKCDAVLLLSYAGQFMGGSDSELLRSTLPAEGIKERVLIGSKFDSALIDAAIRHGHDLQAAAETVKRDLMDAYGEISSNDGPASIGRDDVLFMSAMCAVLATKDQSKWSAVEHDAFDTLRQSYPDWLDSPVNGAINDATKTNLRELVGRRAGVDGRIATIRDNKDKIIREKVEEYLTQKTMSIRTGMEELIDHVIQDWDQIRNSTLHQLHDRQKNAHEMIDQVTDQIVEIWAKMVNDEKAGINRLKQRCEEEIEDARESAVSDFVKVEIEHRRVGKPGGFLGLRWIFRELTGKPHYDVETYEKRVPGENLMRMTLDQTYDKIRSAIRKDFDGLFGQRFVSDVKRKLQGAIADILDNEAATEIASSSVKRSVGGAVEAIAERARSDLSVRGSDGIGGRFDVAVQDDVKKSSSQARDYINTISDGVTGRIAAAVKTLNDVIEEAKPNLVARATEDLRKYYERLQKEIADREFKLQRYEQAVVELRRHDQRLTLSA